MTSCPIAWQKRWSIANRKFTEEYKLQKGDNPNFPSEMEWMEKNNFSNVLHKEIRRLTLKKCTIAVACNLLEREAYTALNGPDGFVSMMSPNEPTSEKVPNFTVRAECYRVEKQLSSQQQGECGQD